MINFLLLINRQGKVRLGKWYATFTAKEKARIIHDICQVTLNRPSKLSNIIELNGRKYVCRRYASLFFIACIDDDDNELIVLDLIHLFVCTLDKYFGNVCELDLIFNFHRAYLILDEIVLAGELLDNDESRIRDNIDAHDRAAIISESASTKFSVGDQVMQVLRGV